MSGKVSKKSEILFGILFGILEYFCDLTLKYSKVIF